MKTMLLSMLSLILFVSSCTKSQEELNENRVSTTKKTRQEKPYVKLKGKPHRQNGERKEHGGPCDCNFCFGLCDVKVEVG